ncbi:ABC transporter ATP-binding protein [Gordonia sp. VNK21]|uniref:ABC transporter ATP-binding protein n=1 Tax=Gordonia sp. VNK21 TaxID=3382483 RepID=UPI0038D436D4
MSLHANGIGWDVGRRRIVDEVSLRAEPGTIIGLLGPNGSGKSSLLRVLAGLRPPARGTVLLDGTPLHSMSLRAVARRVAFVEQSVVTDQDPTVADVIDLGRTPHRRGWSGASAQDRRVLARVCEQTELTGLLTERYRTLSGGERQRVQIARAFAQEPTVMILDEPTNHLDIKYQLSLLELVTEHVRTAPAAAVIALHDLNLAAMFCDEVLVLEGGRVVAAGTPPATITAEAIDGVFGVHATVAEDDGLYVRLRRALGGPDGT